MSITYPDHTQDHLNRSLAESLRRMATWLTKPPVANMRPTLPKELADAEDWLLDDLGLAEPADRPNARGTDTIKRQG